MRYCLTVAVTTLVLLSTVVDAGDAKAGGLSGAISGITPGSISGFMYGAINGTISGDLGQIQITGGPAIPPGFPGTTLGAAPPPVATLVITPETELAGPGPAPPLPPGSKPPGEESTPEEESLVVPSSLRLHEPISPSIIAAPIVEPKLMLAIPPPPVAAPR